MRKLSAIERKGVEVAIAEAEKGTSAEFVAVVASRADRYHVVSLAGGILAGSGRSAGRQALRPGGRRFSSCWALNASPSELSTESWS